MQASVERAGGKTIIRFTRDFDDTFSGEGPIGALAAYHSTETELGAPHLGRTPFELSLAAGATDAADGTDAVTDRGGVDGADASGTACIFSMHSVIVSAFLSALGMLFL